MSNLTFDDLVTNNVKAFTPIDPELMDFFMSIMGEDAAEEIEDYDLREKLDYDGSIHELVDGKIDIYYHALREWAVNNFNYVDEAIELGLTAENADFHSLIQSGQYVKFEAEMNEEIEKLSKIINDLLDE